MAQTTTWILADNVETNTIPANVSSYFTYNMGWDTQGGGLGGTCSVPDPTQHNASYPAQTNLTFSGTFADFLLCLPVYFSTVGTAALLWGTLQCLNTTDMCGYTVVVDGGSRNN